MKCCADSLDDVLGICTEEKVEEGFTRNSASCLGVLYSLELVMVMVLLMLMEVMEVIVVVAV